MPDFLKQIWKPVARYFLAGVLAILPVVVTVAVVVWVAGFVRDYVGPDTMVGGWLKGLGTEVQGDSNIPYVIGWLVVLAVIFAAGVVVELGAKKILHQLMDVLFRNIPIVGSIYSTSKQVIDMFDKKDDDALQGMSAVFCFFGESGAGVLAFLVSPEKFTIDGQDYHIVIIPTAPVPFGGAMLFVPVETVKPADMSVDGLMSIYVSMGVTAPEYLQKK